MPVPGLRLLWVNFEFETGNNAEIVAGTSHRPEEVLVARLIHSNRRAIGQDDVQVNDVIQDQPVESLQTPMAAT